MSPPPTEDLAHAATLPGGEVSLTAEDAVAAQGRARMRAFGAAVTLLALASVVVIPFVGRDTTAKALAIAGVLVGVAYYGALRRWLRRRASLSPPHLAAMTVAGIPAAWAGLYYFGPFSPFGMVVALAVYLHALVAGPRRLAAPVCAALGGGHLLLGALALAGAIQDPGLVSAEGVEPGAGAFVLAAVAATYGVAWVLGRHAHASAIDSSRDLEQAARAVAVQSALLTEARQELLSAVGAGGAGRLTGERLGDWNLHNLLGRGSMGEVYEARHTTDDRLAAVKVLHPDVVGDPRHLERFTREVRATASLDSPYVVDVLDASDGADGQTPYLVMERLVGRDLADVLRDRGRLTLPEVLDLARQIAAGLEAARQAGLVHRDLKPHNLFLAGHADERTWKVLDFGIAELIDQSGTLTRDGVVGTPGYMAPEQIRGAPPAHRADVYSLAAIVYRALVGRPAFPGTRPLDVLNDVLTRMPVRPSALLPLPADIDDVLAIGLAKEPRHRFHRATGFAEALALATQSSLDPALRSLATEVTGKHPWRLPTPTGGRR